MRQLRDHQPQRLHQGVQGGVRTEALISCTLSIEKICYKKHQLKRPLPPLVAVAAALQTVFIAMIVGATANTSQRSLGNSIQEKLTFPFDARVRAGGRGDDDDAARQRQRPQHEAEPSDVRDDDEARSMRMRAEANARDEFRARVCP